MIFRKKHSIRLLASLLFFSVLASAQEPIFQDSFENMPSTSSLNCEAPALLTSVALPFERVEVTGIQGIGDNTWVEYETSSGTTGITVVFINAAGKPEILVPPNPDDLVNGGSVLLTVTDGLDSCTALELEVLAITPVQGDPLTDVVVAIDELTAALAIQFGVDPATAAAASLADLPPQAILIALLLEARAAFDPATALAGLSADEATFLQAMLAAFDLVTVFSNVTTSVNELTGGGAVARLAPAALLNASLAEGCGDLGTVPGDLFDLSNPQQLSDYIKAARGANDTLGPLRQSISDTGAAFAVMGLAVPPVGVAVGWITLTTTLIQQMRANLYPNAITRLEYQLDEERIEEDWDPAKNDPPIKWNFAKIWATNNGMGLARVGLDFMVTAAQLPSGVSAAIGKVAAAGLEFAGKNEINRRLDELEQDPSSGAECWGVGSTEFGPVVIDDDTGEKWVTAEVITGDAIAVDGADIRKIEPKNIGTATLRVRTQPDPFPGPFGFEDKSVEVLRKEVVWIPSTLLVENPGETVTVKFRVDNSKHNKSEDVQMTPGPGLPPLEPTFSAGVHTITFATPSEADAYPTFINVCSTSKELPPEQPNRCAKIDIFADERVEIAKRDVCVGPGQTETFTAVAGGPGEIVVLWEIESGPGDLSTDTGLTVDYKAPSMGSGTVTLRAYIESKQTVEDRITFRYGQCSGLAAYYGTLAEVNFPFTTGGQCSNPDFDDQFEEITFPEEGLLPLVPPAPGDIWVNRTERFSHLLQGGGVFGRKPSGSDNCVLASFSAVAEYDGTLTGSEDGTRLDIDITTRASSNCEDMGEDIGVQCSSASALMQVAGRIDFDLKAAANYRLNVDLSCDAFVRPGFPPLSGMVSIIAVQVEPNGNVLPPNGSNQPIQIQCIPGSPLVIDQLMQFPAPAVADQVDHVMVMFQMDNLSMGALPPETEPVTNNGFLRGFVSVVKE